VYHPSNPCIASFHASRCDEVLVSSYHLQHGEEVVRLGANLVSRLAGYSGDHSTPWISCGDSHYIHLLSKEMIALETAHLGCRATGIPSIFRGSA
jgi:hypothetical protein